MRFNYFKGRTHYEKNGDCYGLLLSDAQPTKYFTPSSLISLLWHFSLR